MADKLNFAKDSLLRTVTASIFGTIVLYILFLGEVQFFLTVCLITSIGALEWSSFLNLIELHLRCLYSLFVLIVLGTMYFLANFYDIFQFIICFGVCFWVCLMSVIFGYEKQKFQIPQNRHILAALGLLVLGVGSLSIIFLYRISPYLVLVLLCAVWSIDICAYVGGKFTGRRKFMPRISPNKTWEGVYIGALGGVIVTLLLGHQFSTLNSLELLILYFFTFLGAVFGDLFESLMKRMSGIKDSGRLLPGHGGILDRIDSVLAAAPAFALALIVIEI